MKLSERASREIATRKGVSRLVLKAIQFAFGNGTVYVLMLLVSLSLVVATGSLAGSMATAAAIIAMIAISSAGVLRSRMDTMSTLLSVALLVSVVGFFVVAGGELGTKVVTVAKSGFNENLRITLWTAAERMIHDAPLLGFGLGTYQQAYPLYEDTFLPYIMDKAHNDYLELAAGWGLPAAISWLASIGWLVWMCVRGIFVRQRDRVFALLGIGAATLVGVHSLFDFPLQIPAISLLFSAMIGLATAQSLPSGARTETRRRRRSAA
jgi:O-antigen ligase